MAKFVVLAITACVVLNSVAAETRKSTLDRHYDGAEIGQIGHSTQQASWRAVNLEIPRRRDPLNDAASYIANLVDDVAISPSGSGEKSDLKIKPWVSGRSGLGVKVELTW